MRVRLQNDLGQVKEVKLGFSWTVFFFTSFVPLIRQDWKWAGIMWGSWAIAMVTLYIGPFLVFAWNIFGIVMAVLYNEIYVKGLIAKGFKPMSDADEQILIQKGIAL